MYQFKFAGGSSAGNKKLLMVAWVIALVLIPIFYLTVTGRVAVDEKNLELDQKLSNAAVQNAACSSDLKACGDNLEKCNSELTATKNSLNAKLSSKEVELAAVKTELSQISFNISYYETMLSQANSSVQQCQFAAKAVVVSYAKDVCCRPGLDAAKFGIVNNRITCSGNYNINCTSGQSDY